MFSAINDVSSLPHICKDNAQKEFEIEQRQ